MQAMFDALTARAIGAELQGALTRGRVQAVLVVSPLAVGFEIYANRARRYLLASADPERASLHLVPEKLRTAPLTPTPFTLLLRKYTYGAFIDRVEVVPHERVLHIEFDHAEYGISTLVVELIGRHSNLILLDAGGVILDSVKRVPAAVNRVRVIQPRAPYIPPPPQAKADPLAITPPLLAQALARSPAPTLADRLIAAVGGTSPLLARELAFRVTGDAAAPYEPSQVEAIYKQLWRVWNSPAEPTLGYDDGELVAVAAYELHHLPRTESHLSMSAALVAFFGAQPSYAAVKAPYREQVLTAIERLSRMQSSLERELLSDEQVQVLRLKGDLILGYAQTIHPRQKVLHAEQLDEPPLEIALDPALSPVENANRYYAEYHRAKDARERVPARLTAVDNELTFARQVLNDLELAETRAEIDDVLAEAQTAGLLRAQGAVRAAARARSTPRTFTSPDGLPVLVGRTARQNEEITFERAGGEDLWLHARGVPGAHVVILGGGTGIPETTVEFAASLAAFYSQARTEGAADVIVTPRKHVRRVSGGEARPGMVTVRLERVVRVRPSAPDDL